MGKTIVINSSNYVIGSGNRYEYRLPQTSYFPAGSGIGVSNIAIYNSIQNINEKRGNNLTGLELITSLLFQTDIIL